MQTRQPPAGTRKWEPQRQKEAGKSTCKPYFGKKNQTKPNRDGKQASGRNVNRAMCEGVNQEGKGVVATGECPMHMRQGRPELLE